MLSKCHSHVRHNVIGVALFLAQRGVSMRRMRRMTAVSILVAALGMLATVGASAAPPTFKPAEQRCETVGGTFFLGDDEIFNPPFAGYACILPQDEPVGPAGAVEPAGVRAMCESAYGGTYVFLPWGTIGPPTYVCILPA
jgi:hypothetical protein